MGEFLGCPVQDQESNLNYPCGSLLLQDILILWFSNGFTEVNPALIQAWCCLLAMAKPSNGQTEPMFHQQQEKQHVHTSPSLSGAALSMVQQHRAIRAWHFHIPLAKSTRLCHQHFHPSSTAASPGFSPSAVCSLLVCVWTPEPISLEHLCKHVSLTKVNRTTSLYSASSALYFK